MGGGDGEKIEVLKKLTTNLNFFYENTQQSSLKQNRDSLLQTQQTPMSNKQSLMQNNSHALNKR